MSAENLVQHRDVLDLTLLERETLKPNKQVFSETSAFVSAVGGVCVGNPDSILIQPEGVAIKWPY